MAQRSLRILKLLSILIDRAVYRCHSNNALLSFSIDRILFRFFSDRVLFDFSVIESSSGSAVIDSSLGSSMLAIFLSNRATTSFIRNRCFFLHSLYSQKQLVERVLITSTNLVAKKLIKKYLNDKDTKFCIENIYHQLPDLLMSSNYWWIFSIKTAPGGIL